MRIIKVELKNFRIFKKLLLEELPEIVVFVSPNGLGKSTILEAIIGMHDLVVPYDYNPSQNRNLIREWPSWLRNPISLGADETHMKIVVQANSSEEVYLKSKNINSSIGEAHFVIRNTREIVEATTDETIKELFAYHNPLLKIGYFDYHAPIRSFGQQVTNNLESFGADLELMQSFTSIRHANYSQKYYDFKKFVLSQIIKAASHETSTGERVDFLKEFRNVFDIFFFPKRLIGPYQENGITQIIVRTPFGDIDTDNLSDGEKEILNVLAHLYRFRDLENIVLWDTPETHLNAALESRLYDALRNVAPRNQYWITTHSLELIASVPQEHILNIKQRENEVYIERLDQNSNQTRISLYRDLGANIGLQLVSNIVVFVEGKESNSDKRVLDRLVGSSLRSVNFIAGGDCESILALNSRANKLLKEAYINGDFLAIVDRDYYNDEEINRLEKEYKNRVFIWRFHEIENLLLNPELVFRVLQFHDISKFKSPDDVLNALYDCTCTLREWIAADWVSKEVSLSVKRLGRYIQPSQPKQSLIDYFQSVCTLSQKISKISIEEQFQNKLDEIDSFIETNQWLVRLPGKQIYEEFRKKYAPDLSLDKFRTQAVSVVINEKMQLPEIDRLINVLKQFL